MKYKIKINKVHKKLTYDKLHWIEDVCDNEWLGKIIGFLVGYICFFFMFFPCTIMSLCQLKSYAKKIQYDIDQRPEHIKNWLHLGLVENVEE